MELFQNASENLAREYQSFLDYLENNQVVLAPKTGNIGKKDCFEINKLFQIVKEPYSKHGRVQENYAVIDFFYFFSINFGILQRIKKRGKGLTVQRNSQRYHLFSQMSSLEQYILMMSVWFEEYSAVLSNISSFDKTVSSD